MLGPAPKHVVLAAAEAVRGRVAPRDAEHAWRSEDTDAVKIAKLSLKPCNKIEKKTN